MSIYSRFGGFFTGEGAIRMDEFEKNVVSFDNLDEEPETGKTVEIETPKPAAPAPEVSTVIEPNASYKEPAHAAPVGPAHSKPKEKKYVTNLSMGVIGSELQHPYIKDCMSALEHSNIVKNDGTVDTKVTNYSMSEILQQNYGFIVEDKLQELREGIVVYPSSVFADRLAPTSSPDAYTFHWGEMSWFQPKPRGLFYKICWNLNMMRFYHWIETKRK